MPSPQLPPDAYRALLDASGDDPQRRDLRDTPERAARAHASFLSGYSDNPLSLLHSAMEPNTPRHTGPVLLRNLTLYSHCEHHMLPMEGVIHVAYRPGDWILGLSKIARAVQALSAQLQSQERLTREIADALEADTITLEARGIYQTDSAARQEILSLFRL